MKVWYSRPEQLGPYQNYLRLRSIDWTHCDLCGKEFELTVTPYELIPVGFKNRKIITVICCPGHPKWEEKV